ncbi:hypothetical protein C8R45DRAFT_947577 [Mycena sanguinolenta]|nr:hypothetical protein C8R45DRAFT_947577 [Mycena sanguinolenta]
MCNGRRDVRWQLSLMGVVVVVVVVVVVRYCGQEKDSNATYNVAFENKMVAGSKQEMTRGADDWAVEVETARSSVPPALFGLHSTSGDFNVGGNWGDTCEQRIAIPISNGHNFTLGGR